MQVIRREILDLSHDIPLVTCLSSGLIGPLFVDQAHVSCSEVMLIVSYSVGVSVASDEWRPVVF